MKKLPRTKKIVSRRRPSGPAKKSLLTYKLKKNVPVFENAGQNLFEKISNEFRSNQSYLNLILGLLIILVAGVLVFNYLKKTQPALGPAQQISLEDQTQKDTEPGSLPGKYTVKDGDTLFKIAEAYYKDGWKFAKIAEENKLVNADVIAIGQVLNLPKIDEGSSQAEALGTGGATNSTIWGDKIEGDTYKVEEGDWLSKIAGRAYGDITAYDKIAKANNISNPDVIEPGTVLKIPR